MEYIIIGLGLINFILLIIIIINQRKKTPEANQDFNLLEKQIASIAEVKLKIDSILKDIKIEIDQQIKENTIMLKNEFLAQNTSHITAINNFEKDLNEQFNKKFNELNEMMNARIKEIQDRVKTSIDTGFEGTSKSYKELIEQLTLISQAKENIDSLSNEVISLKNVLENNQNRGKFGEFTLERILYSIFGDAKEGVYAFQYQLRNEVQNERPDAVIFLPEPNNILCIDSKFPFADYQKIIENKDNDSEKKFGAMIKKHITDIANKYIIKNITADYAILFIPSDAIFGYINAEMYSIIEYAQSKKVILSSPSTLQPILATINLIKIQYERNRRIDTILKLINDLSKKFQTFITAWNDLSKRVQQLDNERAKMDRSVQSIHHQFEKIDDVQVINNNDNIDE